MTAAIHTERDTEGLHTALASLFEESFHRDALRSSMPHAKKEDIDRMVEQANSRTLSPGYYSRAMYLLELGSAIETGISYSVHDLDHSDVVGLSMLRRAKAEFEREHPFCPSCGTRLYSRFAPGCHACSATFKRGGS